MSATLFTRFSLPLDLHPTLNKCRSTPMSLFPARQHLKLHQRITSTKNRGPTLSRSMATDGSSESAAVPKSVPVRVALDLLQAGHRYLDVRTAEEFIGGHAIGATNIPYMFKAGLGMTKNPNFLKEVSAIYGKDDEIIVGCLSGKRSLMAAAELLSAGYTGVTDIAGGYSTWVQNGLPTEK